MNSFVDSFLVIILAIGILFWLYIAARIITLAIIRSIKESKNSKNNLGEKDEEKEEKITDVRKNKQTSTREKG